MSHVNSSMIWQMYTRCSQSWCLCKAGALAHFPLNGAGRPQSVPRRRCVDFFKNEWFPAQPMHDLIQLYASGWSNAASSTYCVFLRKIIDPEQQVPNGVSKSFLFFFPAEHRRNDRSANEMSSGEVEFARNLPCQLRHLPSCISIYRSVFLGVSAVSWAENQQLIISSFFECMWWKLHLPLHRLLDLSPVIEAVAPQRFCFSPKLRGSEFSTIRGLGIPLLEWLYFDKRLISFWKILHHLDSDFSQCSTESCFELDSCLTCCIDQEWQSIFSAGPHWRLQVVSSHRRWDVLSWNSLRNCDPCFQLGTGLGITGFLLRWFCFALDIKTFQCYSTFRRIQQVISHSNVKGENV